MKKERAEMRPKEDYPDMSVTASARDCTGLMATVPVTAEEYEAYQELYGMEIPRMVEEDVATGDEGDNQG